MRFLYVHINPKSVGLLCDNLTSHQNLPNYYLDSIHQTRMLNPSDEIYLVVDDNDLMANQKHLLDRNSVKVISAKYLLSQDLSAKFSKLSNQNRGTLFYLGLMRFPVIELVMERLGDGPIMFIEGDNVIYLPVDCIRDSFEHEKVNACGLITKNTVSSGILFVDSLSSIRDLNKYILGDLKSENDIDDMTSLFSYYQQTNMVNLLPSIPDDGNVIFDPASWGQYLGGDLWFRTPGFVDKEHDVYQKFLKENIPIIKWDYRRPILLWGDRENSFFNLHVHNKESIKKFTTWAI